MTKYTLYLLFCVLRSDDCVHDLYMYYLPQHLTLAECEAAAQEKLAQELAISDGMRTALLRDYRGNDFRWTGFECRRD